MTIFDALTIDRWIALASSLGTLVAALLAAFSIREVRLQRSQQFQPRIAPTSAEYDLKIDTADMLNFDKKVDAYLPIVNVGHGVATDLSVDWVIELDDWVSKVNTLSAQRGAGVGVQRDNFGLALLYRGQHKGGVRIPTDARNHFPYIVPVSSDRDPTKAAIPGAIVLLLNAYYWSYFRGLDSVQGVYRNPSSEFQIRIRIGYKDTVGRAYTRGSILSVNALLEGGRVGDDEPMHVRFVIQPVNNEPAEGYSTVARILLDAFKKSVDRTIGLRLLG